MWSLVTSIPDFVLRERSVLSPDAVNRHFLQQYGRAVQLEYHPQRGTLDVLVNYDEFRKFSNRPVIEFPCQGGRIFSIAVMFPMTTGYPPSVANRVSTPRSKKLLLL